VPAPATFSNCGGDAASGGISVNSVTSCPFAEDVESAWNSSADTGSGTVAAYSPVTDQTYTMYCTPSGTGYEVCTGGNNAYVEFAASSTVPQQASGQFVDVTTLTNSVANEQQAALAAAPSSGYDSSDNATVTVTLTSLGDTFSGSRTVLSGFLQLAFRHLRAWPRHNGLTASHSGTGSLTEGSSCNRWV
jgi:hypothetical protein